MKIESKFSKRIELIPFIEEKNNEGLHKKYLQWLNDIDIVKSIASESLLKEKKIDFIYKSFDRFTTQFSQGFFIKFKKNSNYIGTCKLDHIDMKNRIAWDGIMIGERDYHGKGLSIEVYKVLLDYAFLNLNLKIVYGGCSSYNLAMIRTFKKIGYTHYDTKKYADYIDGSYYDHLFFKLNNQKFKLINEY